MRGDLQACGVCDRHDAADPLFRKIRTCIVEADVTVRRRDLHDVDSSGDMFAELRLDFVDGPQLER